MPLPTHASFQLSALPALRPRRRCCRKRRRRSATYTILSLVTPAGTSLIIKIFFGAAVAYRTEAAKQEILPLTAVPCGQSHLRLFFFCAAVARQLKKIFFTRNQPSDPAPKTRKQPLILIFSAVSFSSSRAQQPQASVSSASQLKR